MGVRAIAARVAQCDTIEKGYSTRADLVATSAWCPPGLCAGIDLGPAAIDLVLARERRMECGRVGPHQAGHPNRLGNGAAPGRPNMGAGGEPRLRAAAAQRREVDDCSLHSRTVETPRNDQEMCSVY